MEERLAVVGSGAIGCGLAAIASRHGPVALWARSDSSAERARSGIDSLCGKIGEDADPGRVQIVTDLGGLARATFVVEAVVEDQRVKEALLEELGRGASEDAVLATTTSSLPVEELARASGRPDRFVALHVFNPVAKMKLVELAFTAQASERTRLRARALCQALGKTPIEVPDIPGFVVNRLLFPYLFAAVRLAEETGLGPDDIDACMKLGAGYPLGPFALLDLIGLDVARAIGGSIGEQIPPALEELIEEGALGRKSGRGFHGYRGRGGGE
ncbi:MAG TPA: 3-hydroxyacyl-CoA dehydrogenase family protein [Solirubrobacteraceae bacterium]|jgi:3-hydroxybutyryl-CoA dehydrogenase|nr:3-hydroxyacyl-CoA dehydrogenase family protein [Solirubrobacteraceae bacterium]